MRVSTVVSHQIGVRTMSTQESKMLQTMQQLASGRRILTPADDPLGASQAVNIAQTAGMNARYADNRSIAYQNLATQEQTLSSISGLLHTVSTRIVEAGNGTYADEQRLALANVLRETRETLLGQANATDGNGQYLFSGNAGNIAPYGEDGRLTNLQMAGERLIQVSQTRQMSTADSALDVFHRVAPGAQSYLAESSASNTGTVTFGKVEVVNPQHPEFGRAFRVEFGPSSSPDAEFELIITDALSGEAIPGIDPQPYVSGQLIEIAGVRLSFSGAPVAGDPAAPIPSPSDSFTVRPPSLDLFADLDNLIEALETPADGNPVAQAALQNALATANRKFDLHLDNVLTVRASTGSRMNELDALDEEGGHRALNYQAQLSAIEDLDYRAAASAMAVQSVALQAAELAYMKVQALGLFNR